jgi:hypothetical protein
MSKLLERLRKNSDLKPELLKNSKYFASDEFIKTDVPILNLAFTGSFKGGMPKSGITMIAAPPKHFKTNFMLEMMKGFQNDNENKDFFIVLYDSEKGYTPEYFEKAGLDMERIDHRFITSVEEWKSDIANLVENIEEGDNVLIVVDSIGMLPSKKEAQDALDGKDTVDMTRAKQLKSAFRIITPHICKKNVPVIIVNHSYQTLDLYGKEVAAGGRGAQYAGHTLWFITKAKDMDGKEQEGFVFTIRSGLSRYVKENATFPVTAEFGSGIQKYSGIFDIAKDLGYIISPKQGWYKHKSWGDDVSSKRRKDLEEDEVFMQSLVDDEDFEKAVNLKFKL